MGATVPRPTFPASPLHPTHDYPSTYITYVLHPTRTGQHKHPTHHISADHVRRRLEYVQAPRSRRSTARAPIQTPELSRESSRRARASRSARGVTYVRAPARGGATCGPHGPVRPSRRNPNTHTPRVPGSRPVLASCDDTHHCIQLPELASMDKQENVRVLGELSPVGDTGNTTTRFPSRMSPSNYWLAPAMAGGTVVAVDLPVAPTRGTRYSERVGGIVRMQSYCMLM
uniref:Uncharacterized protein n=1 Tax=Oryza sativa subsp. japonica TaxID=39947 RepID=Q8LN29_ORYSJ|nr:hypothetical protein [Oryza sativa Japonica Group]